MRYVQLGSSGLTVSVVGLGGNNFGRRLAQDEADRIVGVAIENGITLFDTADMYGPDGRSEEQLGAAMRGRRDEMVVATKFGMDVHGMVGPDWMPRGSREYIVRAVEGSLRRLGTDRIDLFQYHEPDGVTPVAETLAAMSDLVDAGKVRYIGTSNMAAWQLVDAAWTAREIGAARFVTTQTAYHLLDRRAEREVAPACVSAGMSILPYYPLANGLLSGKYRRGERPPEGSRLSWREGWLTDAAMDRVEALRDFAQERGRTLLEVAIGGLAAQPAVGSVIAGAMRPEQVAANAAAGDWDPTPGDLAVLDAIVAPGSVVVGADV